MTWLFREASPLLVGGMMVTTGAGGVLLARRGGRITPPARLGST